MLYFSRFKIIAILSTACLVMLFALPNLLPARMIDKWPQWAQRHIVLGLDLRGGSHLLLEVDAGAVRKEMAETLRDDVRRTLQSDHIAFSDLAIRGGNVELQTGGFLARAVNNLPTSANLATRAFGLSRHRPRSRSACAKRLDSQSRSWNVVSINSAPWNR
jgi:preprotein translocase subunit SecD